MRSDIDTDSIDDDDGQKLSNDELGGEIQSRMLSEQTTVAFLSAIIASIAAPNLLAPAGDLSANSLWSSYWYVQWLYGFLWCWATTSALLSIMLSISLILAYNSCLQKNIVQMHRQLTSMAWADIYFPENTPRIIITLMMDIPVCLFFFVWRPNIVKAPLHLSRASVFWLLFAICLNIYFNINAYFVTHMACLMYGLPVIFRYHNVLVDILQKKTKFSSFLDRTPTLFVKKKPMDNDNNNPNENRGIVVSSNDDYGNNNKTNENNVSDKMQQQTYTAVRRSRYGFGPLAQYEVVAKIRSGELTLKSLSDDDERKPQVAVILIQCRIRSFLAKCMVAKQLLTKIKSKMNNKYILSTTNGNTIDYKKVYALLTDKDFAIDSSVLMKYLADKCVKSFEDLEFLEEEEMLCLVDFVKPGVPKKKLAKLLKR